ncbi:phosphonate C-P lyase system protein PhnG [uncultured Ferrovibrio sp.]|jgi:alpha-D-ribose 1-methylphosphonate 5-triphosphate synthase subunit PhnG|uniref:phosphonate C-P lyase system protein PhnG n=1 Tax=uncultured Ferrovibrio sp. TaxID=1576913 RepID=UPI0026172AB5|nr:phosphonate C-P lyase system protein PhnG [uncultured Ferrovibrio sp.]
MTAALSPDDPAITARQRRLAILARTDATALQQAWDGLAEKPRYRHLKVPETGLVMVRARAGGVGQRFNLGEMTVTRCVVAVEAAGRELMGVGYVQGRDARKAELVALFDALALDPAHAPKIEADLIVPAQKLLAEKRQKRAEKVAATKVDFFTLVRGEG